MMLMVWVNSLYTNKLVIRNYFLPSGTSFVFLFSASVVAASTEISYAQLGGDLIDIIGALPGQLQIDTIYTVLKVSGHPNIPSTLEQFINNFPQFYMDHIASILKDGGVVSVTTFI